VERAPSGLDQGRDLLLWNCLRIAKRVPRLAQPNWNCMEHLADYMCFEMLMGPGIF
jgi:hypothetical protein